MVYILSPELSHRCITGTSIIPWWIIKEMRQQYGSNMTVTIDFRILVQSKPHILPKTWLICCPLRCLSPISISEGFLAGPFPPFALNDTIKEEGKRRCSCQANPSQKSSYDWSPILWPWKKDGRKSWTFPFLISLPSGKMFWGKILSSDAKATPNWKEDMMGCSSKHCRRR